MKIALVQCPSWTPESPPYSLALLAATLKRYGHDVVCFDLNIELYRFCAANVRQSDCIINNESWSMDYRGNVWYDKNNVLNFINKYEDYIKKVVDSILKSPAKIIGFSVQSTSKFFSLEIARRIKEKDKEKIVVFGGPLCFRNCYGIDILKDFSFLDFTCFGEGEEAFPSIAGLLEKDKKVDSCIGFGCRLDGNIIDRGDAKLIGDLDDVPFADYSGLGFERYTKKLLPIATSRGCINKCTFCNESAHWQRYRKRSAQNILEEIKFQLKKFPELEWLWFNDSLINGDIEMLNELCDLIISNNIKIRWGGQGMIRKEMTRELLQRMKSAGCSVISYGVESGSSKILRLMKKGYTPELSEKIIKDTHETGIEVIFNIIVGYPYETEIEFNQTRNFIQRCKSYANHIELVTLLLLKDSYIYNNLNKFNISPIDYTDSDWQLKWKTEDGKNTYEIRKKRLEELREFINKNAHFLF